jgi:hypothetical protein
MATETNPRPVRVSKRVAAVLGEPKRLKISQAAVRIGVSYSTIWNAVAADVFTVIAPKGRGVGKPLWLHTEEIDAFSDGREDAVRALRIKLGRFMVRK